MNLIVKKIREFGELVVFEHSLFSMPFIFIAMVAASRRNSGWFGFELFFLALFAAVFARNFAMSFNRLADRRYDAMNPRTAQRPSVDGRLSAKAIAAFAAANAALLVAVAYLINPLAFKLAAPFLCVLASYSYIKRFSWSAHLVLGLSLSLAPIAGAVAVLGTIPHWVLPLSAGVIFWVAGFDLLYALQDRQFDQKMGLFSIPAHFGEAAALKTARVFHLFAFVFWVDFCTRANLGVIAFVGAAVSGVLLVIEHRIAPTSPDRINRAFFKVNAWLGIIFLIFIIMDAIWQI